MRKLFLTLAVTALLIAAKAGDVWALNASPLTSITYFTPEKETGSCSREQTLKAIHSCFLDPDQKLCLALQLASCKVEDPRVKKLEAYFAKHNSPLTPYAYEFVYYADQYNLDWKLVPAITGVESTFGKHMPKNSYNAYGWANGNYRFTSWPNSIEHVSKTLREKYYDKGADTIPKIARRYAPPSTTWGGNVTFFMNKIETFEVPPSEI